MSELTVSRSVAKMKLDNLFRRYGEISAEEAIKRACDIDRQLIDMYDGSLEKYSALVSQDDYQEMAALQERYYVPLGKELSVVQRSVINTAKTFFKDCDWYQGIRLELLPETDEEILAFGLDAISRRLVEDTVMQDSPCLPDGAYYIKLNPDGKTFLVLCLGEKVEGASMLI